MNCSPSLDQPAGLFPASCGQHGPHATDRSISSIGASHRSENREAGVTSSRALRDLCVDQVHGCTAKPPISPYLRAFPTPAERRPPRGYTCGRCQEPVGGDVTLRAPGRGLAYAQFNERTARIRTAHGNGTAFSAVAPSERAGVAPSIDSIFGSDIPQANHPTFRSLIGFRLL